MTNHALKNSFVRARVEPCQIISTQYDPASGELRFRISNFIGSMAVGSPTKRTCRRRAGHKGGREPISLMAGPAACSLPSCHAAALPLPASS
jgi:hypothetical protein